MNILALNAGSSSLKFRLGPQDKPAVYEGAAEVFGKASAKLQIRDAAGAVVKEARPDTLQAAAAAVLEFVKSGKHVPVAIGHRFVHGGPHLQTHCRIDDAVRSALQAASAFAPLHNPPALEMLALVEQIFPDLPQIACLDTVFHARMPEQAKRLPLPRGRLKDGLRRYGFHGLSCESILDQLDPLPPRLVIAHLGGGASVTAVRSGLSVDTTMGLTPDGGVMMETRSGDLDPGLLLYLLRHGETADTLEQLLNRQSGIAGVSGHGGDLRDVRAAGDAASRLALEMFTASVAKAIAGMATVLGGIDLLVLTGGIGEHDAQTRSEIAAKLSCLGPIQLRTLPAQEERIIQQHTAALVAGVTG